MREGTEGPYVGNGGSMRTGTPHEVATEVSLNTAFGVERVVRDAFTRAQARDRKILTLVHKTNVLVNAGGLWARVFGEVAPDFPDVTTNYLHVDAATIKMTVAPESFDVIVTDNLFGDILTDLAAAVTGGIGLAASGNINPARTAPSMFEPVHGSAPDIAGTGKADPTAAVLSIALMLEHLGQPEAAARIEQVVGADLAARAGSPSRSTAEIGDALAAVAWASPVAFSAAADLADPRPAGDERSNRSWSTGRSCTLDGVRAHGRRRPDGDVDWFTGRRPRRFERCRAAPPLRQGRRIPTAVLDGRRPPTTPRSLTGGTLAATFGPLGEPALDPRPHDRGVRAPLRARRPAPRAHRRHDRGLSRATLKPAPTRRSAGEIPLILRKPRGYRHAL